MMSSVIDVRNARRPLTPGADQSGQDPPGGEASATVFIRCSTRLRSRWDPSHRV